MGTYLGGHTIIRAGKGFSPIPEGGEALKSPSPPTPLKARALERSEKIKKKRTARVRKLRAKGIKTTWMKL